MPHWRWELACTWLTTVRMSACIYMHIVERLNPSALTVMSPGSTALNVLCVSAEAEGANQTRPRKTSARGTFKTGRASLIYPQTSLSLTLSPARDRDAITQDQMEVMSSLWTNGPWLTASFIVLNGVSVVPNDSAAAYINVVVVFGDCTLCHSKCLHWQQSKEEKERHYTD